MAKMTTSQAAKRFAETIHKVSTNGERIILRRGGKNLAAIVPIEDWKAFELLEDRLDVASARRSKRQKGKPIPLEKVAAELGIRRPRARARNGHRYKKAG